MKLDWTKLFDISARMAGAIIIACGIFMFFPSNWLPFDITEIKINHGTWIFVAFVISIAIWISYFFKWVIDKIKDKFESYQVWKSYKYILENLSNSEKYFLKEYYDKRETAIFIDMSDPIHKRLQTFQVISMTTGHNVGRANHGFPGFIHPWVFELIDKNPKYLEITQEGDFDG